METPLPQKQAAAYLAQQLFELYLLPTETGRIELIDGLLEQAGIDDTQARDTILKLCDKADLTVQAHKKDLARLLLRSGVQSLDAAEQQLRLTFG